MSKRVYLLFPNQRLCLRIDDPWAKGMPFDHEVIWKNLPPEVQARVGETVIRLAAMNHNWRTCQEEVAENVPGAKDSLDIWSEVEASTRTILVDLATYWMFASLVRQNLVVRPLLERADARLAGPRDGRDATDEGAPR